MANKPVLSEENIRLNVKLKDKADAIRTAGGILVANGYVEKEYIDDMFEREKSVSTYIGNHLAIPHGITKSFGRIKHSGISFLQVPDGVQYGDEVAYLVVGIAGIGDEHMDILGKLALICSDMDNIDKMRNAKTKKEILDIINNFTELN